MGRNSKVTMASEPSYRLEPKPLRSGKRLTIYTMAVNDVDEFWEFMDGLDEANESDVSFTGHFWELLGQIVATGTSTRQELFWKIVSQTDMWEIRRRRGRENHRFYGFMVDDREFYIVRYRDKRGQDPDKGDLTRVARVRKAWLEQAKHSSKRASKKR